MNNNQPKAMRDVFIEKVYEKMRKNSMIFFLSADLGSPALDKLRNDFKDRFINVGIAEQNLINVATGLALEGYAVYAYGIAPFVTMRAYEQIRQNLSISSQIKPVNVNIIGVGAGLSYDVSGPSHHCLEDISIMKLLPNFMVFSPSDWKLAEYFVDYSINIKMPKYLRFDGRPLPLIYEKINDAIFKKGFHELLKGKKVCLVSTGFMTHRALKVAKELQGIGVIDVFMLKPLNENLLFKALKKYKYIITIEEGFINNGGLDSLISKILRNHRSGIRVKNMGFNDKHVFEVGDRDYLHRLNNLDENSIIKIIKEWTKQ
ncbi:MAG: transketolase C-terminal domain-containing protein [Candidatus Buchananbacteria bacterium]|nr:transketolase C-terminal domain-containing protein [Candidatus Buchananbacteria bacterium]